MWGALAAVGAAVGKKLWDDHSSRKAAKQQYNYQMDMWNANNVYNSPLQQMERLREAGLNPNLVYGNGSATHTATMASAPSVGYKAMSHPLQNALLSYQVENMRAQNDNLKAQNELLKSQAESVRAGIPKTKAEARVASRRAYIADEYGTVDPHLSSIFGAGDKWIDYGGRILNFVGDTAVDFYRGARDLARDWKPKSVRRR